MTTGLTTTVNILQFYLEYRKENRVSFFKVYPVNGDVLSLDCIIPGPAGTIWEGGEFTFQLSFPGDFPANPPQAKFIPSIYHPNVFQDGRVTLGILNPDQWKKETTMSQILLSAQALLNEPNTESPSNEEANNAFLKYKKDSSDKEYVTKVKECVENSKQNPRDVSNSDKESGLGQKTSGSGFGQKASGSGFGQKASGSGFGQKASGSGFGQKLGGFGQAPPSTGFGQKSGGFGQAPPSTGFSQKSGGFGQAPPSTGFGQKSGGFGQAPPSTGFGQKSGGFGQAPPSTGWKKAAEAATSTGFGQNKAAGTTSASGWQKAAEAATSTGFGHKPAETTGTGFGQNKAGTGFGQKPAGTTGTGFGQKPAETTTGTGFGQKPAGTTTGTGFGQKPAGTTTSTGFGQKPAETTTGTGFGQKPAGTTTGTGFGQKPAGTTTSTGFGQKPAGTTTSTGFGHKPAETTGTGFGQNKAGTGFGQKPAETTSTGFGHKPAETTSTGFGQKPAETTSTGFGQKPAETTGTGFGQNKVGTGFGQKPAGTTTSTGFGHKPAETTGTGFGQKPAETTSTGFGQNKAETTSTGFGQKTNQEPNSSVNDEISRLKAENERLVKENESYRQKCEALESKASSISTTEFNGLELIDSKTIDELQKEGKTSVTISAINSYKVHRTQQYLLLELNVSQSSQSFKNLIRDHQILHNLNHPNIQRSISYSCGDQPLLILQFVPYNLGDVMSGLSNSWKSMAIFEVCQAMEAAHKSGLIHRNLNPLNILFDENGHVRVSEFGLSNLIGLKEQAQQTIGGVENARFMAPELINERQDYNNKVDVYSFAIFVFFILTGGELPAITIQNQAAGKKPKLPNGINQISKDLINKCWEARPDDRPSFTEISKYIRDHNFNLIDGVENELDQIKSFLSL